MKYGCGFLAFLILLVVLVGLSYYAGQKTDTAALVNAIQHEDTLDRILQLRQEENGRNPLFIIFPTVLIAFAFLVVFNMKEINKVLRSVKALSPFQKRRNGRSRNQPTPQYPPQPYVQQLPQTYAQPQLPPPGHQEHDHDF